MNDRNTVVATGRLSERQPLRYTPAGIPMIEFRLIHESEQLEAGIKRQVQCEFTCLVLGDHAVALSQTLEGEWLAVKGFMAARSRRWPANLILHITDWKINPSVAPN